MMIYCYILDLNIYFIFSLNISFLFLLHKKKENAYLKKKELIKINDEKLNMLFNFIYSKQKII